MHATLNSGRSTIARDAGISRLSPLVAAITVMRRRPRIAMKAMESKQPEEFGRALVGVMLCEKL
jgi:hypothetical protein